MRSTDIRTDCVIVGGGVAGLWLHNLLNARGLQTLLIEADALGAGQTGASQGLIHSGVKYALNDVARADHAAPRDETPTMAAMPARWRTHLQGLAAPNLQAVPLLSEQLYLWSTSQSGQYLPPRFTFASGTAPARPLDDQAASHLLRKLPRNNGAAFSGEIFQLEDFAIDIDALLRVLAAPWQNRQLHARVRGLEATVHGWHLQADVDGVALSIDSRSVLLCAGAGNAALLAESRRGAPSPTVAGTALAGAAPSMQLRALHQVFAKGARFPELFGHFVTAISDTEPQLTITTHQDTGTRIWSLGGALATGGVSRSTAEQIERARAELRACLPWLDLGALQLATLRIDRAEAQTTTTQRPDAAFVWAEDGLYVCWPNKLTLMPDLADRVLILVEASGQTPRDDANLHALAQFPKPVIAPPPWRIAKWK